MERRKVLQFLAAAGAGIWSGTRLASSALVEGPPLTGEALPKTAGAQENPIPDLLLPLFPLELVLLPHVNLPLHIFEERYKELIGDCLKYQWEFGILAVQEESVKSVGCTASITEVLQRFPDGRMNILTRGRRRFEISQLNEDRSYLRGKPRFFDDDETSPSLGDLPKQALEIYARLRNVVELQNESFHEPRPTAADSQLSFRLMAGLPAEVGWKQELLELRSEQERLTRVIRFFEQLLQHLEQYREKAAPPAGPVAEASTPTGHAPAHPRLARPIHKF
jgi:Lon protease-like protein